MAGWEYHRATAYFRGKIGGGWWERGDVPSVFKTYPGLPSVSLPRDIVFPSLTLEELLTHGLRSEPSSPRLTSLSLNTISSFLFLSYGVTLVLRDERFSFRTVPSAGALYPAELYIAVCGVPKLRPGIYNYNAGRHSLTEIARLDESRNSSPALQAFVSGIFYRSSCKYRDRAFRYVLLDCGHLLEQVFLAGQAVGFRLADVSSFKAAHQNIPQNIPPWEDVIAVDPQHEIVVGTVTFENFPDYSTVEYNVDPQHLKTCSKVARRAPVPPSILDVSKATSESIVEICRETESSGVKETSEDHKLLDMPFATATLSRRSRRNYLIRPLRSDAVMSFAEALKDLILHSDDFRILLVMERCGEVFPDGIYELFYGDSGVRLVLFKQGFFLRSIARAALDQIWLGDAVIHVIIAARLIDAEDHSGHEAYRRLLVHAGRIGQRVYLVSESLDLGCCGVGAFYDEELRSILGLTDNWDVLYLLGVGRIN